MKDIIEMFNEYAKTFDLTNKNIMKKFHHSYRVMEYGMEIANSLNLNEKEKHLVQITCLFHDIARFKQWSEYETYVDDKSFDHGDMGYETTKELFIDKFNIEEKDAVLKAIKNHNKLKIEDNLNDIELLLAKIVRDADKMDIMLEQGIITKEGPLSQELIDELFKHNIIGNSIVEDEISSMIRLIAFIFDFNFKYTYKFTLDKKIIENKINILEIYTNTNLDELKDDLINYMKGRLEC